MGMLLDVKPVIASIGHMGASDGYYIALRADMILADEASIVDSIGVVSGKISLTGLMEKIGITRFEVARGASAKPLRMREYPSAALQGLFTENHSPDGNLNEYRFIRAAGFGAYNRVGAVAFHIGNAAYQIPAGYETPLAV